MLYEVITDLYRDLLPALAPGGALVIADLVEPAGPRTRALAAGRWEQAVGDSSRKRHGDDRALRAFRALERRQESYNFV